MQLRAQRDADALATVLYAVIYAYYGDFENGVIASTLRQLLDDPFDSGNIARLTNAESFGAPSVATKPAYSTPQTNTQPPRAPSEATKRNPARRKQMLLAITIVPSRHPASGCR